MAKGTKLDLSIGATFEDEWSVVHGQKRLNKRELLEPSKHFLHFKFEKRRGKPVTLVGPFSLTKDNALALVKKIKKSLGSGGAYKDDFMEFQGECKERLRALLEKENFRFKK